MITDCDSWLLLIAWFYKPYAEMLLVWIWVSKGDLPASSVTTTVLDFELRLPQANINPLDHSGS